MGKAELKIDAELLAQAQAAGLKVEAIAERAVRVALSQAACAAEREAETCETKAAAWAAENADAIRANRERIEAHGPFGEDLRSW